MNIYETAFRKHWLTNVQNIQLSERPIGFSRWLIDKQTFSLATDTTANKFCVSLPASDDVVACFAWDINRLLSAVIETGRRVEQEKYRDKELAWLLVKMYYGAFYSAHSILRICGRGVFYVDDRVYKALRGSAIVLGMPAGSYPSAGGLYSIKFDHSRSKIDLEKIGDTGRSHVVLWDSFCKFAKEISTRMLVDDGDPEQMRDHSETLESIVGILAKRSDHSWLSWMRNEISYKQDFGVWYPNLSLDTESANFILQNRRQLVSKIANIYSELENIEYKPELQQFYLCCKFIICLSLVIAKDIEARGPGKRSLYSAVGLKLYKQTAPRQRTESRS